MYEQSADVVVIGGSAGGCAAALAACRSGCRVVMTEENPWIGGQFTSQLVPPDEHRYIESFGSSESYRRLRRRIRSYYLDNFPVSSQARSAQWFNPGNHECSSLACEPRAALAALTDLLARYIHSGKLIIHSGYRPIAVETDHDRILSIRVENPRVGETVDLSAPYFLDATELGDLLPLAGAEHVIGAEPQEETGEAHAYPGGNERCQMALTWCYAIDYIEGQDFTIDRPDQYERFHDSVPPHWPNPQLSLVALDYETMSPWRHTFLPVVSTGPLWQSLWTHRRMIDKTNFSPGTYDSDIVLVNWTQNDYLSGPIIGVDESERRKHLESARQLSLSLLYWLQTEAPRVDGGHGFPGLRLRPDVAGTADGLAMSPYIREARRIKAQVTMLEQHISAEALPNGPRPVEDAVAVGYYFLDMHQRTESALPFLTQVWPFQIPLGALIPQRIQNLIPACKNLGVTHVVNSATRVHPIEWVIGEAAGTLAALCITRKLDPEALRSNETELRALQSQLVRQGVEIGWPTLRPVRTWDEHLAYTVNPEGVRTR